MKRGAIIDSMRRRMKESAFFEFTTPILTASSPEGARDFLVPSRLHPGKFYALPQAPQQFKQLIMISGFDRYFQIAPCFRDEDPRADRLPGEFYQLDVEMSFVTQEDVFQTMEPVIRDTFKEFADGKPVTDVFPRIKYFDALLKYGTDKPDLRNPLIIADVSEEFSREEVTFNAFKNVIKSGGVVRAIPATGAASQPRSFFDKLNEWARTEGAPGLGYVVFEEEGGRIVGKGPIAKFIPEEVQAAIREKAGLNAGDAVFFSAGTEDKAAALAGKARVRIGDELGLGDKNQFAFAWIVDFPQYEWNEDEKKIDFSHNPFSMPAIEPEEFLALDRGRQGAHPQAHGLPVRHRLQRLRDRLRRDPQPSPRHHEEGVRDRRLRREDAGREVRRHVSRLPVRRAAARRHGGGHRPHRHAALRRGEPARDHAVPDEPAGRGPAARRAFGGVAEAASRIAHPSEPAGEMIAATAIVVTFDSAHALPDCLDALQAERVPTIVVDNASLDDGGSRGRRGREFIRNLRNEGYGRANNIGSRAAGTEFLLIVNPDVIVEQGAVAALLDAARRYPDAGLFAPQIVEPSGRVFFQPRSLLAPYLTNPRGKLVLPEGEACAPFFSGACFLVRRDLFLRLGGFDENIFLFYEDDDLCRRIADGGSSLVYVPQASCGMGAGGRAGRSRAGSSGRAGTRRGHAPM